MFVLETLPTEKYKDNNNAQCRANQIIFLILMPDSTVPYYILYYTVYGSRATVF